MAAKSEAVSGGVGTGNRIPSPVTRRKAEGESVFETVSQKSKKILAGPNEIIHDLAAIDKLGDWQYQKRKLKIAVAGIALGCMGGHIYSVFRGFNQPAVYMRQVLSGGCVGFVAVFPVLQIPNLAKKKHKWWYGTVNGALIGGMGGYLIRGPAFVPMYAVFGILSYCALIGVWYQVLKPIYYYHMLKWPNYNPPFWWPYQPVHAVELFEAEVERERLNVIFPEDLEYFRHKQEHSYYGEKRLTASHPLPGQMQQTAVVSTANLDSANSQPLQSSVVCSVVADGSGDDGSGYLDWIWDATDYLGLTSYSCSSQPLAEALSKDSGQSDTSRTQARRRTKKEIEELQRQLEIERVFIHDSELKEKQELSKPMTSPISGIFRA